MDNCKSLARDIDYCEVFARRLFNVAAHKLARAAACSLFDQEEWNDPPPFILDVILADLV